MYLNLQTALAKEIIEICVKRSKQKTELVLILLLNIIDIVAVLFNFFYCIFIDVN